MSKLSSVLFDAVLVVPVLEQAVPKGHEPPFEWIWHHFRLLANTGRAPSLSSFSGAREVCRKIRQCLSTDGSVDSAQKWPPVSGDSGYRANRNDGGILNIESGPLNTGTEYGR